MNNHRLGITLWTALLSWLVTTATLLIFVGVTIPMQRHILLESLESKAYGLSVALLQTSASASIGDLKVAEAYKSLLSRDPSIEYLIFTRNDGLSQVHYRDVAYDRPVSDIKRLALEWHPYKREPFSGITPNSVVNRRVFSYSMPIDYSERSIGWIHVGLSLKNYDRSEAALYHQTGLLAVVCLILSFAASVIYAKRLVQPILSLQSVVQKVADGDLSARASIESSNEVGSLGNSVNLMTESLLHRDTIMQSLYFAAQQFISAPNWQLAVNQVLANIGQAVQATSLNLFENGNDKLGNTVTRRKCVWLASPAYSLRSPPVCYSISPPDDRLKRGIEVLQEGKPFQIHHGSASEAERILLDGFGIKALIIIPIFVARKWWGLLTVGDHRGDREWPESEIVYLQTISQSIGSAIERQLVNEGLVCLKDAAEAASRAKSQFLANMSHEIRTPLHAILGYAQILQRNKPAAQIDADSVNTIARSGRHLLELINDILDLSKIEAGRSELHLKAFDLVDFTRGVSELFRKRCQEKNIQWRVTLHHQDAPWLVQGDEGKLRQVLGNLLGNAVKYTERGEVVLAVEMTEPGRFTFVVSDSGMGIAPTDVAKIFQPFYQGTSGQRKGGTGLGLAIAQSHLKLMGSQLECLSELGKGSRFSFSLHMDLVPCLDAQGLKSHSQRIKSLAAGVVVRAMVVDDVKENRAVLSQFLQSIGVLCLQADSGKLALEILRQRLPEMSLDIVFCDIKMPGMSGLEFTRILVEEMHCKRPILVAVTAFAFANQRQEYLKAGFDEFLPKPVQAEALYQVLTQTLKVEFDYEPVPSEAPQTLDWANLKIPAELREAIVQAARMHSVTDLGECVVALLELGSAYEPLAWQIRSFARGYDMKSILDLMNKMNLTA